MSGNWKNGLPMRVFLRAMKGLSEAAAALKREALCLHVISLILRRGEFQGAEAAEPEPEEGDGMRAPEEVRRRLCPTKEMKRPQRRHG